MMMNFSDVGLLAFFFFFSLENKKEHLAACNQSIYSPREAGAFVQKSQGLFWGWRTGFILHQINNINKSEAITDINIQRGRECDSGCQPEGP